MRLTARQQRLVGLALVGAGLALFFGLVLWVVILGAG